MLQENINIPKYLAFLLKTSSLKKVYSVADPREGAWGTCAPPPPLLDFFFLQKRSLLAKLVLNKHKICLKMLEMAILETQIFKNFCGSMPPDPPRKLAPSALVAALPPPPFANPGTASAVLYYSGNYHEPES